METIDLAFDDREMEHRFARLIVGQREEVGGILFIDWGRLKDLHWAKHQRLFGVKFVGLIKHWLLCPNVSNLRDREYQVSDLKQLIGIAEQTAESTNCLFLHFHSHPNRSLAPSDADLSFWNTYFKSEHSAFGRGVVVTENIWNESGIGLACHNAVPAAKHRAGRFLSWDYVNHTIRYDARKAR